MEKDKEKIWTCYLGNGNLRYSKLGTFIYQQKEFVGFLKP